MNAIDESTPPPPSECAPPAELLDIRREIDALDATLVDLVARRADLARSTASVKAAEGLPFRDHRREADLVRRAAARARERGLDPEPVRSVFWTLVEMSHAAVGSSAPATVERLATAVDCPSPRAGHPSPQARQPSPPAGPPSPRAERPSEASPPEAMHHG